MQELDLIQGTPEWHTHRFEHLNASEAPFVIGKSKNQSRDELLYVKFTREEKAHSKFVEEVIFAGGHASEAGARPIIEQQYDIELSPLTVKTGKYSASFDGINFTQTRGWEHKKINKENIIIVEGGEVPEEHTWQLEHHFIACPSLEYIIFTVSDGTADNMASVIYKSDPKKRKKLKAAWKQFEKDLADYVIPEVAPVLVANQAARLPALTYEVKGTMISANLGIYRQKALEMVADSEKDLLDDQAFVDAKDMVKAFEDAESKIKLIKQQVLAEFTSLDEFTESISEIGELVRRARINTSNKVDSEQKKRKKEIIDAATEIIFAEIESINKTFPDNICATRFEINFTEATKNKRTIKSLKESANQYVADCKIKLNDSANLIRANLKFYDLKAADHKTLFPDLDRIIAKNSDDFVLTVENRIMKHQQEEREKAEAIAAEEKKAAEAKELKEKQEAEALALKEKEEAEKQAELEETAPAEEINQQVSTPVQQKPAALERVECEGVGDNDGFYEASVETPGAMENFSDEKHDIDLLIHTANHFKGIVFPDLKTSRGQQIAAGAKSALESVANKIIKATETL